jgi:4-oxalocrotonate tautomerase
MPYVNVKMYAGRTEAQKREVARRIAEAICEVCGVPDPNNCPVVIEEITPAQWTAEIIPEVEAKAAQRFHP